MSEDVFEAFKAKLYELTKKFDATFGKVSGQTTGEEIFKIFSITSENHQKLDALQAEAASLPNNEQRTRIQQLLHSMLTSHSAVMELQFEFMCALDAKREAKLEQLEKMRERLLEVAAKEKSDAVAETPEVD